jgi:hypothetical protein
LSPEAALDLATWIDELKRRRVFRAVVGFGEALALWQLGRRAEADRALARLEQEEGDTLAYQAAAARAFRGEHGLALDWLERAYRQEDGGLTDLLIDPSFDPLRGEPRFQSLLAKVHLPVDGRAK